MNALIWPGFDPVAVRIGPLAIHWYGIMYLLGFLFAWWFVRRELVRLGLWGEAVRPEDYESLFSALVLGVILGGRIGYVLFYNLPYYAAHPLEVFMVWKGGMSFHGGLVGAITAGWLVCKRRGLPFWKLADRFVIAAPVGLALGRLGNFINGELWGRPADVPWAMIFPHVDMIPRHPSQLYEMALEGVALFLLMWMTRKKPWPDGARVALFLAGYAAARIVCEQFREPDPQLGFLWDHITMGMVLSFFMFLAAGGVFVWLARRKSDGLC